MTRHPLHRPAAPAQSLGWFPTAGIGLIGLCTIGCSAEPISDPIPAFAYALVDTLEVVELNAAQMPSVEASERALPYDPWTERGPVHHTEFQAHSHATDYAWRGTVDVDLYKTTAGGESTAEGLLLLTELIPDAHETSLDGTLAYNQYRYSNGSMVADRSGRTIWEEPTEQFEETHVIGVLEFHDLWSGVRAVDLTLTDELVDGVVETRLRGTIDDREIALDLHFD